MSLVCCYGACLSAGEVSEQEALRKALLFMEGKTFGLKSLHRAAQSSFAEGAFYVFNADDGNGFVIVSADDRTEAILGYADEGSLDMDCLPANARAWLEGYARQIRSLSGLVSMSAPRRVVGVKIGPLLTCKWEQGGPYNWQCPEVKDESGKMAYTMTGCPATAQAQVMYFHRWPESVKAMEAYKDGNGNQVSALPATTFKWDKMKDVYSGKENKADESAQAVAELMRYCGQAMRMAYGVRSSGGSNTQNELIEEFAYSKGATSVARAHYSTEEWESIIYNEMNQKRPVLYSGYNESVGHSFVVDGYDGNGLFHVNWGWSGSSDGYFVLSDLNPSGRGSGGGTSENGYTLTECAIIGIQRPVTGESVVLPTVLQNTECDDFTFERNATTDDFTANVTGYAFLNSDWFDVDGKAEKTADIAWALCQDGKVKKILAVKEGQLLDKSDENPFKAELKFGAGVTSGEYDLMMVYRFNAADEWQTEKIESDYHIQVATINGNKLTVVRDSETPDFIKVNGITFEGDLVERRPVTAVINWTRGKHNFLNENPFYLRLDGGKGVAGAVSSYVDRGATQNLKVVFKSETYGARTLKLSSDEAGKEVFYTMGEKVDFRELLEQELTSTFTIQGLDQEKGLLAGTDFNITLTFTNEGKNAYDDKVDINLTPVNDDESSAGQDVSKSLPLKLAVGATASVSASFTGLMADQRYLLMVSYFTKLDDDGYSADSQEAYYFRTGTASGIQPEAVVRSDAGRQWFDLQGRRLQEQPAEKGVYIVNGRKVIVN